MRLQLPKFLLVASSKVRFHNRFPWVIYDPKVHKLKGFEIRQVFEKLRPGDILDRSLGSYLDTLFIPGYYSHAALYVGDNTVIHATSKGTNKEDILDFLRCDGIADLRIPSATEKEIQKAIDFAWSAIGTGYDFEFESGDTENYCSELISTGYQPRFEADFEMVAGNRVITPMGLYTSKETSVVIEFRH